MIASLSTDANYDKQQQRKSFDDTSSNSIIVKFDGLDDHYNARNWSKSKKGLLTILYGLTTMGATWSSAIYSTGASDIAQEFDVGEEIVNLGTSFMLIGFGTGPLLWAPLSEIYGRKLPVVVPYFAGMCFTFGTGVSANFSTVLITRFLAGFFTSAPVSITGGVLADMFDPRQRGLALVGYAAAVVGGPVFAPIAGGAIMQSNLGWRWTQYITGIYMILILLLDIFLLHETYAPVLLSAKARQLRLLTGNWAYHAEHDEWEPSLKEMSRKFLVKPFNLLGTPVCFLFALHASFIYSIVYLNLGTFPLIFQEERGWNQVIGNLPFLALIVGIALGGIFNIRSQKFYLNQVASNHGHTIPEARLPPMMAGSISITGGLFLMGNTADVNFHWTAPIIAAMMMGFGFFTIFQAALNYLIDAFPLYGASAVAANTFMRSMLASLFPPLVSHIHRRLGVRWTLNLLGFIALSLIPIPWLFYYFGKTLRKRENGLNGFVYKKKGKEREIGGGTVSLV